MIFKLLLVFGVVAVALDYAWTIAILIYAVVAWLSIKTSDKVEEAKKQNVVAPQPQPYPDMSFAWNNTIREYMRDEITSSELGER